MGYIVLRGGELFGGNFGTIAEAKAWAKRNASQGLYRYDVADRETLKPVCSATFCINMRVKWQRATD